MRLKYTRIPSGVAPSTHPGTRRPLSNVTAPSTATSRTPVITRRSQSVPASQTRPSVADGTRMWALPRRVGRRSSESGIEYTVVRPRATPVKTMRPPVTNSCAPQAGTVRILRVTLRPVATSIAVSRLVSDTKTIVSAEAGAGAGATLAVGSAPASRPAATRIHTKRAIDNPYVKGSRAGPRSP